LIVTIVFSGSLVFFMLNASGYKRDQELLSDINKMLPYFKEKDTVRIKGDMWNYYNLHSYLYMAKQVNLTLGSEPHHFLILSPTQVNTDPLYEKLELGTKGLDVFRRKDWSANPSGK